MGRKEPSGISLSGKDVSGDPAMEKVIAAQSRMQEMKRENAALRKDIEQLLEEYHDMRMARSVPVSPMKTRTSAKSDRVRVSCGDVHGMRMDKKAVAAFLSDLKTLDPDEVVLGGDILECGGWLAKHQPVGFVALADYSYQEDIKAANWFLDEVQKAAQHAEIHYCSGNHEFRVERWIVDQTMAHQRDAQFLMDSFGPASLLRLEERGVHYYERDKVYVDGAPRGWMRLGQMYFTHELGKSKNAARDSVLRTAGNVTYFHTHRSDQATVVFPTVGIVTAFCPGCLSEIQPIWKHSDPTSWSQGYGIDIVAKSGNFQHINVPIWRGESLAGAMVERFRS